MTTTVASPTRFLLPPEAYWSGEWYERECATLFRRVWHFCGPVDDVPLGSTRRLQAGPECVVITRAPHELAGTTLAGAPVAVDTWLGYVFVHLDPIAAPPLVDWLGELPSRIKGFRPDLLTEVVRARFEVACNWKLYIENHIDIYHLWYLHETSLGAYDHPRHSWWNCAPHWAFYEPPRAGVDTEAQFVRGFPLVRHIEREAWGSGAHLIFPNVPFASGAAFFMTYQCIPRGPEHTTIDLRVRAEPDGTHDTEQFLAMASNVLHAEDGAACEQVQRNIRSPYFAVGPLARDLEEPITRFHESVLSSMEPRP